ncbi:glycosyltransferase [Paenibacillus sp. TH7-28]
MENALVTVVIPFYNPGRFLEEAIESVFQQIYPRWKLLLIDDGSTEQYESRIKTYLSDPRVKLIRLPQNAGQSQALNQGLELADTPFIVQLDSDDWFYPHTLEVLAGEALKQPEEVAVVSGNILVVHEDANGDRFLTTMNKGRAFADKYDFLLANTSLWPRFYRTNAIRAIGGWPTDDPYQGRVMEDKRILLRLIERYRFHWIDQMLYIHRRHTGNHTNQIGLYAEMVEWSVRDALQRWGSPYEPVFENYGIGWKKLARLVAVAPSGSDIPAEEETALIEESTAAEEKTPTEEPAAEEMSAPATSAAPPAKPSGSAIAAVPAQVEAPGRRAAAAEPEQKSAPAPQLPQPAQSNPARSQPAKTRRKFANSYYVLANAGPGTAPFTGPGTGPYTGPGTAPGTGPGT